MKECWTDDKESRPTFLKLKQELDDLISHEEKYNYMQWNGESAEAVEGVDKVIQPPGGSGSEPAEESEMPPTQPMACNDSGLTVENAVPQAQPSACSHCRQEVEVTITQSAC